MRFAGILVLLAALGACRPQALRGPQRPSGPPLPEPAEVLASLRAQGVKRQSMRALGRVDYFGTEGRVRLKAVLLAKRSSAFRVETLSPFEQPVSVMTCDGDTLWLLADGRLRTGKASPANISRFLPLAMGPDEVVGTLLGGVPTSTVFQPVRLEWSDRADNRWLLTLTAEGETIRLLLHPELRRVEAAEFVDGDVFRVRAEFEDFEPVEGETGEFPRKIVLQLADRADDVRIKLQELELNSELDEALFRMTAPPGLTAESLDDL